MDDWRKQHNEELPTANVSSIIIIIITFIINQLSRITRDWYVTRLGNNRKYKTR
jgi:hypothetical protein